MNTIIRTIAFLLVIAGAARAWDSEQLEVFDIVEEVKENFYNLLNISQNASNQAVKSAFRGLTLKLHPDKNPTVDTSVQFRNLVSVYEVLRSTSKRKYYDEVLVNGLPNWRSAVYYYRYVRKIGMVEVCIILFVIITIGQYLVNWAAYLELKYTIEQNRKIKRRKSEKQDKTGADQAAATIPKPSVTDTLPVQIPRLIYYMIIAIPETIDQLKTLIIQQIEEITRRPPPTEPATIEIPQRIKTVRKRNKGFVVPEGPNFNIEKSTSSRNATTQNGVNIGSSPPPIVSGGGLWTDDDLTELIKLVKRHPGGTPGRWELIAETMGRLVPEVTYMAYKMKENCYKLPSEQEDELLLQQQTVKVKQKTKKDCGVEGSGDEQNNSKFNSNWSQIQQRSLEDALAKYTKGCADRWDRIADCVPDKTKEECMLRFRYLAQNLRKQKECPTEQRLTTTSNDYQCTE